MCFIQRLDIRKSVASSLADRPSACVIWIQVDKDLNLISYWWHGKGAGEQLAPLTGPIAKRIGRTAEGVRPLRAGHRVLKTKDFKQRHTIDEVLETLLGALPSDSPPSIADEGEQAG